MLSGLRFMTSRMTEKTQKFVMKDGEFFEQSENKAVHVYFNGSEVQNGQEITVQTAVAATSIDVTGVDYYDVVCEEKDGKKLYTITYADKTFSFAVTEDIVKNEKEGGCSSALMANAATVFFLLGASALLFGKGGKKHEEK